MKIKNNYLMIAKALGAVIIEKDDIIEKIGRNLKIKKSVFDNYLEDTVITLYINGNKTINQYKPVYHTEDAVLLLYLWKTDYDYFPWEDEKPC